MNNEEITIATTHADSKVALGAVILGGTSVCNASCIHCPTNKPETDNVEHGVMPMDLFCSVMDQLAEDCTISDYIGFGLFGDAFLDPFIVERTLYAKRKFPNVTLSVNSNAAAYSHKKHAALFETVDGVTLHLRYPLILRMANDIKSLRHRLRTANRLILLRLFKMRGYLRWDGGEQFFLF